MWVKQVVVNSVDLVISLLVFVVLNLGCGVCSIVCICVGLLLGFDACVFPVFWLLGWFAVVFLLLVIAVGLLLIFYWF